LKPTRIAAILAAVALASGAAAALSLHVDVGPSSKSSSAKTPDPDPGENPDLAVLVRDENPGDRTALRLRIAVRNRGHHPVHGLSMEMPFRTRDEPVAEGWYAPGCRVWAKPKGDRDEWVLHVSCRDMEIRPGDIWPEGDGLSIGLHNRDWRPFDAKADFHFGREMRPTDRIWARPERPEHPHTVRE